MTTDRTPVEISWFGALCDDDYEFLGEPDPALAASWPHCSDIVTAADRNGFDNVLLPSGYTLGIDSTAFAAAIATHTRDINLLLAVRMGEMWLPQLARQLASIDQFAGGRLTINIISSDIPGEALESEPRYQRTLEWMQVLRTAPRRPAHRLPRRVRQPDPRPASRPHRRRPLPALLLRRLLRSSEGSRGAGGRRLPHLARHRRLGRRDGGRDERRAERHGRSLITGLRTHVIVRETEAEALAAAERLVSRLDDSIGAEIRARSLDSASVGVQRQAALRESASDDGFAEANLWTGIGRARSGAGAAIVGDPDQVLAKLEAYRSVGVEAFVLSGYTHRAECDLFAEHVLPRIDHAPAQAPLDPLLSGRRSVWS
jgi:alkanesulfonate monooxygenase